MPPKKIKVLKVKLDQFNDPPRDESTSSDLKTCHSGLNIHAVRYDPNKMDEYDKMAKEVARLRGKDSLDDLFYVTFFTLDQDYTDSIEEFTESLIYFCRAWVETKSQKNKDWVYKQVTDTHRVIDALRYRYDKCGLTVKLFDYLNRVQLELDRISENFTRKKLQATESLQTDWEKLQQDIKSMSKAPRKLLHAEHPMDASGLAINEDTPEWKSWWKRYGDLDDLLQRALNYEMDLDASGDVNEMNASYFVPAISSYQRLIELNKEAQDRGWL